MKNHHAQVTRPIVLALIKLPHERQRELMRAAVAYLHRQCGPQVGALHDFLTSEPDALLTHEVKEKLLGDIARAFKANDTAALEQP